MFCDLWPAWIIGWISFGLLQATTKALEFALALGHIPAWSAIETS